MFPAGLAGFGLLTLRLCAAAMLARNVVHPTMAMLPWWVVAGVLVIVVALGIGLYTPIACIASGIAQIAVFFYVGHGRVFELAFSVGVALSLLLLGPGSFSVDGRLFGRKRIQLSNSQ